MLVNGNEIEGLVTTIKHLQRPIKLLGGNKGRPPMDEAARQYANDNQ